MSPTGTVPRAEPPRALCALLCALRDECGTERFGDCLFLGRHEPTSFSALGGALDDSDLSRARIFAATAPVVGRSSRVVVTGHRELDEPGLRSVRGRYKLHRLNVLFVANELAHELGERLERLDTVLADRVLLLVSQKPDSGSNALAAVVRSELQGLTRFSSVVGPRVARDWVSARLRRNFCV
jgi:hypothetical protein